MPPKPKVHKDDVILAGLALLRETGAGSINARSLARKLGCSTQPIFRVYENMAQMEQDLYEAVAARYNAKVFGMTDAPQTYEDIALRYIAFARQEKNLFLYLFFNDKIRGQSFQDLIADSDNQAFIQALMRWTGLSHAGAEKYLIDTWIYMHGLATLLATNQIDLDPGEIEDLLKRASQGFLTQAKGETHEKQSTL